MSIPAEVQAYLKGPSCPAPEGETSNLDNPSNGNAEAYFFAILCIILVTTTTFARAYSRISIVKQFHVEDYLGIGAIIPFAGWLFGYFYFGQRIGFFVQQWNLPGSVLIDSGYIAIWYSVTYGLVMLLLKTAIILEWIRIFVPHRTRNIFYWSSIILILINLGFYTAGIAVTFGNCRPLEKLWHFWVPGTCIESKGRDLASGAINLALDLFILALPQRVIWALKMDARRKIGVAIAFSVGLLVVATAIGRLHTIITMDYPTDTTRPFNTSYKHSQASHWALSEVTCIFLVFCVPALPKLFADPGIMSQITAPWRSWMRLPQQSSPKPSQQTHWPRDTPELQCRIGPQNNGDMTEHTVIEYKSVKEPCAEHSAHGIFHHAPGAHNCKTIEFESREEAASRSSTDPHVES